VFRSAGDVVELLYESEEVGQNGTKAVGVKTKDGRDHLSNVVIVAAGPKTHF
jgi:20S proteasome alpha/beta subunit